MLVLQVWQDRRVQQDLLVSQEQQELPGRLVLRALLDFPARREQLGL